MITKSDWAKELLQKLNAKENRGLGHTTNAIVHAEKIGAQVIFHNILFAKKCRLQNSFENVDALYGKIHGHYGPIILDHQAWVTLTSDLISIIDNLKKEIAEYNAALLEIETLARRGRS